MTIRDTSRHILPADGNEGRKNGNQTGQPTETPSNSKQEVLSQIDALADFTTTNDDGEARRLLYLLGGRKAGLTIEEIKREYRRRRALRATGGKLPIAPPEPPSDDALQPKPDEPSQPKRRKPSRTKSIPVANVVSMAAPATIPDPVVVENPDTRAEAPRTRSEPMVLCIASVRSFGQYVSICGAQMSWDGSRWRCPRCNFVLM